jgi:hypothetical protein
MAEEIQGLPVEGYRPQTQVAVDLVNENKKLEESVLRVIDHYAKAEDIDKRWLAIAQTHIEQGFMAMNRAVFRPARAKLAGDA